jgi:hypothetical protein
MKDATERHTTAVTAEPATSAGARNRHPSKSPTKPVAAKANNIGVISSEIGRKQRMADKELQEPQYASNPTWPFHSQSLE